MEVTASPTVGSGAAIVAIQVEKNGVAVAAPGGSFTLAGSDKGTYTVWAIAAGDRGEPTFSFIVQ